MLRIRRTNIGRALTLSVMACLVQFSLDAPAAIAATPSAANATPAAPVTEQAMGKEVGLMENRFFAHQYANDPMEKRLERMELMVFGGTQSGTNDERFQRLKKVIAERPQGSAKKLAAAAPEEESTSSAAKEKDAPESSSQYPVLNTLEWRALKKTFPTESLDARLGRLEQKLFGQDSPTMAYIDRVDRLKRTLGIGITAMQQSGPTGPGPKARPHSADGDDGFGFYNGAPVFGGLPGGAGITIPGFGMGTDAQPFGSSLSRTFGQMFQDMNREMQEFSKLGPGNWVYDTETGDWVEQGSGSKVHPGPQAQSKVNPPKSGQAAPSKPTRPFTMPRQLMQPPVFQFPQQRQREENTLPPYTDPNSI
jgi:hypothetical protein